jgi:endonuclease YncB( thermonuclease family)
LKIFLSDEKYDTAGMRFFLSLLFAVLLSSCAHPQEAARVVRVVDGDTLVVQIGSAQEKVRIEGIDTPETVDPRKPVQCFGPEASNRMKALITGKQVTLVRKIGTSTADSSGTCRSGERTSVRG